jgi:hypothetical protein
MDGEHGPGATIPARNGTIGIGLAFRSMPNDSSMVLRRLYRVSEFRGATPAARRGDTAGRSGAWSTRAWHDRSVVAEEWVVGGNLDGGYRLRDHDRAAIQ